MIVVPVAGDTFKTSDGLPFKVVSYTNYNPEGPAVNASPIAGGPTVTLQLSLIATLNNQEVKLITNGEGYKVFETSSYMKRGVQLPQPDDFIDSNISGVETRTYQVQRIRIHVPNQISSGMILDVLDKDTDEKLSITIDKITDIQQSLFKRAAFLAYYADYTPKGTA